VNRLLSIVPLETLQGWPAVADPSPLQSLALLVGAPAIVTAVIIALVQIRATLTKGYGSQVSESGWAGARPEAVTSAGVPPTSMDTSKADGPPEDTGGASGRW
jgi:hypothetical protein